MYETCRSAFYDWLHEMLRRGAVVWDDVSRVLCMMAVEREKNRGRA
jgi:hypothetical protein